MQLAQVNVARMRAGLDSAEMHDFVAAVDPVYRLADASPGLVWRLRSRDGHQYAVPVRVREDAGELGQLTGPGDERPPPRHTARRHAVTVASRLHTIQ